MTIKELYKYERPDGGVDVSLINPNTEYDIMYRIIADHGKLITQDGHNAYICIDAYTNDGWYEVDDPLYESNDDLSDSSHAEIETGEFV